MDPLLRLAPSHRITAQFGPATAAFIETSTYKDNPEALIHAALSGQISIPTPVGYPGAGERDIRMYTGCTIDSEVGPLRQHDVMIVGTNPIDTLFTYTKNKHNDVHPADILMGGNMDILVQALYDCGVPDVMYNDFYITNMIRFPPLRRGGVKKPKMWLTESAIFLQHELAIVRPKYILCMGSEAVSFFTGMKSVDKAQSHTFIWKDDNLGVNAEVIAAIHPVRVSMNAEHRPQFLSAVSQLADKLLRRADKESEKKRYYIEDSKQLGTLVDYLIENKLNTYAVDTEWGGATHWMDSSFAVRTVQIAWSKVESAIIVLHRQFMRPAFQPKVSSAIPHLQRLLCRPEVRTIVHNAPADFHALGTMGVSLQQSLFFDTMLASHIFEPTTSHSLKDLCAFHLPGWERHDLELDNWLADNKALASKETTAYGNVPDEILLPYAGDDPCATFALYEYYSELMEKPENEGLKRLFYTSIMPAYMPLIDIERTGIYLDADRTAMLGQRYQDVHEFLLNKFRKLINDPKFNIDSPPQKVDLLFNRLGLTPITSTDGKQWDEIREQDKQFCTPCADDETLGILAETSPVAEELQKVCLVNTLVKSSLRKMERNKKTGDWEYQKGFLHFLKGDGRLHCSISQLLKTGRLAAKDPNLMNLVGRKEEMMHEIVAEYERGAEAEPLPGIRSCFCAPLGRLFVIADYKQAEICALAHLSGDPDLIRAVENQDDIHSIVGRRMFKKMHLTNKEFKDQFYALRISAKSIIFGLLYGRGAPAIAREVQKAGVACTVEDAQRMMDEFMDSYPAIRKLIEATHAEVENQHWVETLWGRREYFPVIGKTRPSILARMKRQAFNFKIQGYVGDLLRTAVRNHWDYRLANPEVDYKLVMTVHDSIVHEFDPRWVEEGVNVIVPNAMMHNACAPKLGFKVPIDIDVYRRWDEDLYLEEMVGEYGLREEFAIKYAKKAKDGTPAVKKKGD